MRSIFILAAYCYLLFVPHTAIGCENSPEYSAEMGESLSQAIGAAKVAAGEGDARRIYETYLQFTTSDSTEYAQARRDFVDQVLGTAIESYMNTNRDRISLNTVFIAFASLPIWRSCDTNRDLNRLLDLLKREQDQTQPEVVTFKTNGYSAIRRAEGQLTELLRTEARSVKDFEDGINKLEGLAKDIKVEGTEYQALIKSVLANKHQEATFWYLPFDMTFDTLWKEIDETAKCPKDRRACSHIAESTSLYYELVEMASSAATSPGDGRYFLYNDYALLYVVTLVLGKRLDEAESFLKNGLLLDRRNSEENWYSADYPLDHIYVFKFIRDADDSGPCVNVEIVDAKRNRCPIKSFLNPYQFSNYLLSEIAKLKDPEIAAKTSIQQFDNALRAFTNHDYRVILADFSNLPEPGSDAVAELRSELETAEMKTAIKNLASGISAGANSDCPKDASRLGNASLGPFPICISQVLKTTGLHDGYYFLGGNLNLRNANYVVDWIRKNTRMIQPYLARPPISG